MLPTAAELGLHRKSILVSCAFSLVILALFFNIKTVSADTGAHCDVMVRLVEPKMEHRSKSADSEYARMSSFVEDAGEQLKALPFNEFRPLAMQQARVAKGAKTKFILGAKGSPSYRLVVEFISLVSNQVGLRVDWQERSGREIVSTQLKVPNGENVVLGSDKLKGGPKVILIKSQCK